jgi:hypothetical protein
LQQLGHICIGVLTQDIEQLDKVTDNLTRRQVRVGSHAAELNLEKVHQVVFGKRGRPAKVAGMDLHEFFDEHQQLLIGEWLQADDGREHVLKVFARKTALSETAPKGLVGKDAAAAVLDRGWRATHDHAQVLRFAFLYLYELICGIGVDNPLDGFNKIKAFWDVYRAFEPGIDRFARVWLQDYAVFHGLDPKLLRDSKTVMFDNALIELRRAARDLVPAPSGQTPKRRKTSEPTLPLPPDEVREERLMAAINALSTYNLSNSRLNRSHRRDLRHVACAVYVRMARYYDTHRKTGIVASLFGEETAMPYTMFASAVFFAPERHEDCEYRLDPIHIYRCQNGFWECMRIHGNRQKSSKLGEMMRACDQRLRLALDPAHPLKEEKVPKYLAKIIDDEIVAWLSWDAAHQPVKIDIDLSQLGHIRSAAAQTREALLIDEEREDGMLAEVDTAGSERSKAEPVADATVEAVAAPIRQDEADEPTISTEQFGVVAPLFVPTPAFTAAAPVDATNELAPAAGAYLRALLEHNAVQAESAVVQSEQSEDMLVDTINEALFDLVGDTVIEFGPAGPQIIEDYEADVRGYLDHE